MTHIGTTASEEKILSQLHQTIRDIQYDLRSPHKMPENQYETIRDLINKIEVRFFATATPETLHPTYKKFLVGWTSLMIKQKEVGVDDYVRFFTSDDWQYWKIRTLTLFRFCRNPEGELPLIFYPLLTLLAEAYSKNPEWKENIVSIWQEYCSRVFMLSGFQSVSEKQKFFTIDHAFYAVLLKAESYQSYLKKTLLSDLYIEDTNLIEEKDKSPDSTDALEQSNDFLNSKLKQLEEDYLMLYKRFEILHRDHGVLQKNYDTLLDFKTDKGQGALEEEIVPEIGPIEIDRTQYRFGLIFGSPHSSKSFERDNKNKNDLYLEYGLTKDNFEVFSREFTDQARLNVGPILNRLNGLGAKPLSGLLVFELDHETELNTLVNNGEYASQIFVCHGSSQHYTKFQMRQLLTQLIDTVEGEVRNNQ